MSFVEVAVGVAIFTSTLSFPSSSIRRSPQRWPNAGWPFLPLSGEDRESYTLSVVHHFNLHRICADLDLSAASLRILTNLPLRFVDLQPHYLPAAQRYLKSQCRILNLRWTPESLVWTSDSAKLGGTVPSSPAPECPVTLEL
ncbi:hypothetical protein PUN28_020329 [Cardiocondyla obscurior]|uniref:Uncharacterized protein n=1 Tax=Cardiocondyla obscurior TaxID=286306 RepID=A0AAW2E406_9HYME